MQSIYNLSKMIAYQVGIKPKHSIHLHTVTVSITNMVCLEMVHLVTASGVMAFIKQSFHVLHMLVIKTDLKVMLYSNNFVENSRDIIAIN